MLEHKLWKFRIILFLFKCSLLEIQNCEFPRPWSTDSQPFRIRLTYLWSSSPLSSFIKSHLVFTALKIKLNFFPIIIFIVSQRTISIHRVRRSDVIGSKARVETLHKFHLKDRSSGIQLQKKLVWDREGIFTFKWMLTTTCHCLINYIKFSCFWKRSQPFS